MKITEPESTLREAATQGDLAVRMLGNRDDAADVTQEILLKVVTHLGSFRGEAAFGTWVWRIARNHLLTARTRSAESPEVSLEGMAERLQAGLDFVDNALHASGQPVPIMPHDRLQARQVALGCTQNMRMTLTREQRQAYVLDTVFGLPSQRAAEVGGISPEAYRQCLSRARSLLDAFTGQSCGLANPHARCHCERQLPALRHLRAGGQAQAASVVALHCREMQEVERTFSAFTRGRRSRPVPRPPRPPGTGCHARGDTRRAHPGRNPRPWRSAMKAVDTTDTQPLSFIADDGTPLSGTLHEPRAAAGVGVKASVLVAGGLGIDQRFYAPFAQWLAQRGYRLLTFDWRGMGASRQPKHRRSLRGLDADLLTWARQDFAAAVMRLAEQSPDGRVALVGHSLGMHHAAMTTAAVQLRIAKAVSVAAGSGYWRDWAPASRRKDPLMLHLASPLLTPLLGWFPGKRLHMVGDLPGPAMRQWSRWCRHPAFAWGAEPEQVLPSLRAARFPIHALSFTDDDAMTAKCTRQMLAALPNAPSQLPIIAPADLGLTAIGRVPAAATREVDRACCP